MSDFKHDPGNGTLFINKSENPKAPRLSGQITTPDGKYWDIALWTATDRESGKPKTDREGNKFFSVKVSEPRGNVPKAVAPVDDDDIPF